MKRFLIRLVIQEDGPTAVEYAVMLALIITVCITAIHSMANSAAASFDNSAAEIASIFGS